MALELSPPAASQICTSTVFPPSRFTIRGANSTPYVAFWVSRRRDYEVTTYSSLNTEEKSW